MKMSVVEERGTGLAPNVAGFAGTEMILLSLIFSRDQVFYGNQDTDTVVYNVLSPPITARYIRVSPVEWHNHISLRMEIYGCFGKVLFNDKY